MSIKASNVKKAKPEERMKVPDLPLPPSQDTWLFSPQIELNLEYINGQIEMGQAFHTRIHTILDELEESGYPKKYIDIGLKQFDLPLEERVYMPRSPEFLAYVAELKDSIKKIYMQFYKCDEIIADQMMQALLSFATRKRPLMDVDKVRSAIQSLLRQEISQAYRQAEQMGITLEDLMSRRGVDDVTPIDADDLPLVPVISKYEPPAEKRDLVER